MLKTFIDIISIFKKKLFYKKQSYSFGGVDLLVNYLLKDVKNGFYLDVGAQNPISNNNTYILYKRGWNGINIDLDSKNIALFNIARKKDVNICSVVSSSISEKELYFFHDKSAINTVEKNIANLQMNKYKEIKKVKAKTLNSIIDTYPEKKINYLNIDVEGHELEVLKGFDLAKHKPDVISVEYLDLNMKKLEFKNNNLNVIINSELYKYMIINDYYFVNWNHADLIFVSNSFRD